MPEERKQVSGFPPRRAALISAALTLFIFLFRPFGISIDSWIEAVIVLGLAPLNFIAMLLVHQHLFVRHRSGS